jgi:hypothetical protein
MGSCAALRLHPTPMTARHVCTVSFRKSLLATSYIVWSTCTLLRHAQTVHMSTRLIRRERLIEDAACISTYSEVQPYNVSYTQTNPCYRQECVMPLADAKLTVFKL